MEKINQKVIGRNLKKIRKAKKITQEELAINIGSHRKFISKIERGQNDLRISTLLKIVDALNADWPEIMHAVQKSQSKVSHKAENAMLIE